MSSVKEIQVYNLKWTNHTNNILQMFSEQLQKEYLVDVTLSCEGQFVKAHKMVLSACSPYFQKLFEVHQVDHPIIIMNGVKFSTMQQMIDFMYQGEIKVGDADMDVLLTLAENLQIKGLCKVRDTKDSPKLETHFQNDNVSTSNTPNNTALQSKSRKRRKQSHSLLTEEPGKDSQVNGENSANHEDEVPDKIKCSKTTQNIQKLDGKMQKLLVSARQEPQQSTEVSEDKTMDKQGSKIPRPPNAFMIFANEWRKKLALEYQGESNKEISVRLGNMWKSLPSHTKDMYYLAARKADEDHKIKYPGYCYSPKEARLRKEKRGSNLQKSQCGNMRDIDAASLVSLVLPDVDLKTDRSNNEGNNMDESEDLDVSEGDGNENNDNSNPSPENLQTKE